MKNWITTLGGILTGLGLWLTQVKDSLPYEYRWVPEAMAGIGALILGVAAKQVNVHSTATEVREATIKEVSKEAEKRDDTKSVKEDIARDIHNEREK